MDELDKYNQDEAQLLKVSKHYAKHDLVSHALSLIVVLFCCSDIFLRLIVVKEGTEIDLKCILTPVSYLSFLQVTRSCDVMTVRTGDTL